MKKHSVTVIIVNWNSGDLLSKCIDCLLKQTITPARILVMDNASTDNSVSLAQKLHGFEVKRNDGNYGFARANNIAINESDTEYIALLNPDAFPNVDWLERLLDAASLYPSCASFGSRQMIGESNILDGKGDQYHISGMVRREGYGKVLDDKDLTESEIFSPCACAALYRTDALREVGGFDEDYFCYIEDVDLGFRLRLAGYKAVYVPDAVVAHVGSATTGGRHSDFSVYHGHRNLMWTFVKNMPGPLLLVLLPIHLLLTLVTIPLFFLKGQGLVIIRAKWDAIYGIPMMLKKRAIIQKNRRIAIGDVWKLLDKHIWSLVRY